MGQRIGPTSTVIAGPCAGDPFREAGAIQSAAKKTRSFTEWIAATSAAMTMEW
jgi:hypothetical protein